MRLTEKLKNYDIFLAEDRFFKSYYYPSVFVQDKHKSEISGDINKNYILTYNYGLTKAPEKKGKLRKTKRRSKKRKSKNRTRRR